MRRREPPGPSAVGSPSISVAQRIAPPPAHRRQAQDLHRTARPPVMEEGNAVASTTYVIAVQPIPPLTRLLGRRGFLAHLLPPPPRGAQLSSLSLLSRVCHVAPLPMPGATPSLSQLAWSCSLLKAGHCLVCSLRLWPPVRPLSAAGFRLPSRDLRGCLPPVSSSRCLVAPSLQPDAALPRAAPAPCDPPPKP